FNLPGLVVARVFLGIFEAGFGPMIPVYFCMSRGWVIRIPSTDACAAAFFYTKEEMGVRVSYRRVAHRGRS
ncbi:unnamed protein product, partial [Mycena citricolor]